MPIDMFILEGLEIGGYALFTRRDKPPKKNELFPNLTPNWPRPRPRTLQLGQQLEDGFQICAYMIEDEWYRSSEPTKYIAPGDMDLLYLISDMKSITKVEANLILFSSKL